MCLSGTALRCMLRWSLCPGRGPGLTESVSALRTSPRSPGAESDSSGVVAHLRSAWAVWRPESPCVIAALLRMGVTMEYRVRAADIPSLSGCREWLLWRSSASPKRLSRVAVSDLIRHRCAPTNGGYYEVSRPRCGHPPRSPE